MKMFTSLSRILAVGAAVAAVSSASALQINYDGSGTGSTIKFNGDSTFSFTPVSPANNFTITSTLGGTGSANGLTGSMGGTFTIGAVTTSGGLSTAPVTGTGTFVINADSPFTATLTWIDIAQFGGGSTINTQGGINLTNIVYAGTNTDLIALKGSMSTASDVLTFNFVPPISLSALKVTQTSTSFSASLAPTVPDGGMTVAMLGLALAGLGLMRRKFLS